MIYRRTVRLRYVYAMLEAGLLVRSFAAQVDAQSPVAGLLGADAYVVGRLALGSQLRQRREVHLATIFAKLGRRLGRHERHPLRDGGTQIEAQCRHISG